MSYFTNITLSDIYLALKQILNALVRPIWIDPTTGRVNINSITTLPTLANVTTLADTTRLNNVGATAATQQSALYVMLYGLERCNWAQNVRSRIS
jgi:hypothetical protein